MICSLLDGGLGLDRNVGLVGEFVSSMEIMESRWRIVGGLDGDLLGPQKDLGAS